MRQGELLGALQHLHAGQVRWDLPREQVAFVDARKR
jgi:hypothetical protein